MCCGHSGAGWDLDDGLIRERKADRENVTRKPGRDRAMGPKVKDRRSCGGQEGPSRCLSVPLGPGRPPHVLPCPSTDPSRGGLATPEPAPCTGCGAGWWVLCHPIWKWEGGSHSFVPCWSRQRPPGKGWHPCRLKGEGPRPCENKGPPGAGGDAQKPWVMSHS